MNSHKILDELVDYLLEILNELNTTELSPFNEGQKTAFVVCLEVLQLNGFERLSDLNIEKVYPI